MRRVSAVFAAIILTLGLVGSPAVAHPRRSGPLGPFQHLVVIYQENHSFDNLYGKWGSVHGQRVEGRGFDGYARRSVQVREDGSPYRCLYQNDPSLSTPPLDAACGTDTATNGFTYASHFRNRPFEINDYITPESPTCPGATPGGCTRDLVHRFYQEQYQLDGGRMDRYTTGSDAAGLTQGYYDTRALPIYEYLHTRGAPRYVIADHFFQAAFGGSFLNHQFLIAAQAPPWPDPPAALHSVIDAQGFPNPNLPANGTGVRPYPLHSSNPALVDGPLTQACPGRAGFACGNYAVNTVQPTNPPTAARPGTQPPPLPLVNDIDPAAPNYRRTIGDELSDRNVPWAWYAGGWADADAGHPGPLFQYHHQPFNYFARYAPGYVDPRTGEHPRDHLQDETAFYSAARTGTLPAVSFVKPYGAENEHPGYASTENGERHLVDLIQAVQSGPEADNTLIVVTYDEFGGQWDHVVPPGQGRHAAPGPSDEYGPSTRIPALLISPSLRRSGVDHTSYDTTSILRTIEAQYGLAPLDTRFGRDAKVNDLGHALRVGGIHHH